MTNRRDSYITSTSKSTQGNVMAAAQMGHISWLKDFCILTLKRLKWNKSMFLKVFVLQNHNAHTHTSSGSKTNGESMEPVIKTVSCLFIHHFHKHVIPSRWKLMCAKRVKGIKVRLSACWHWTSEPRCYFGGPWLPLNAHYLAEKEARQAEES